ncbi:gamma-glutamylcyclotransferase [Klebsiella pneumoniae subsp. pneumoniae]|nr:gamma-glutamylcyclotransferase [Klebsiella pneumoniae subsp. pneumoniae]
MLTRDFLMNADCKTAFGAIEESLLWSAEQRAASLAATLACRPDDGSVWIFGYGSLIWNPALIIASPAPARCRAGTARLPAVDRRAR